MTAGELKKALEGVPDETPVSMGFFCVNAPVGFRACDSTEVYAYHDFGEFFIQNQEWDDGAS